MKRNTVLRGLLAITTVGVALVSAMPVTAAASSTKDNLPGFITMEIRRPRVNDFERTTWLRVFSGIYDRVDSLNTPPGDEYPKPTLTQGELSPETFSQVMDLLESIQSNKSENAQSKLDCGDRLTSTYTLSAPIKATFEVCGDDVPSGASAVETVFRVLDLSTRP